MNEPNWYNLVATLRNVDDIDQATAAVATLQRAAVLDDVPRLLELLKDSHCFVREAAGWCLSDLGVKEALPELLEALCRGEDEGHDNDRLASAVTDLAEAQPKETRAVLARLLALNRPELHEQAEWLMQYCSHNGKA